MPTSTMCNSFFLGAGAPPGGTVTEESDTRVDGNTEDPWDETVTVPAGTNRLLIDLIAVANPGAHSAALDPAGANIALTENANSPQAFSAAAENAVAFHLLEASFGTTGAKTLRIQWAATRNTKGHVIFLSGASQTIYSTGGSVDNSTSLVLTVPHPTDVFPAGTKVYAVIMAEGNQAYTVSGDAAEVDDEVLELDQYVYAKGTLASDKASVTVTFAQDGAGVRRKQGILYVVPPA